MKSIKENRAIKQFSQEVSFAAFAKVIPEGVIQEVLAAEGRESERQRKLPARLVVWLCILMNIFSEMGLRSVLEGIVHGSRRRGGWGMEVIASKGSICKARYKLGEAVMRRLFEQICQPIGGSGDEGCFRYGLRLVAIDSTVEAVADSAANEAAFGRQPASGKLCGSAFPQVRGVYLAECGSRVIFDAVFLPYRGSDMQGAYTVLRSVTAAMLVMLDAGLYSFEMVAQVMAREADILVRVRRSIRPRPVIALADGTYLADIYPSAAGRRHTAPCRVRVIEYTLDDPQRPYHGEVHRLLTTLLDTQTYPARELITLYHERWEIELAIDELDTHQRFRQQTFRSRKPTGVLQELYGLLLAYFVIRSLIFQAALPTLDADHLSFVQAFRLIRAALPDFQWLPPRQHPRLWRQLFADLAACRLPPRDDRINPRVVKRRLSKFKAKHRCHLKPALPKPFPDGVVLLPTFFP